MKDETAKMIMKEAAYNKCNIGHENHIYHIMYMAFEAGMNYATYNGRPGFKDAPSFVEWIQLKAYEEI